MDIQSIAECQGLFIKEGAFADFGQVANARFLGSYGMRVLIMEENPVEFIGGGESAFGSELDV